MHVTVHNAIECLVWNGSSFMYKYSLIFSVIVTPSMVQLTAVQLRSKRPFNTQPVVAQMDCNQWRGEAWWQETVHLDNKLIDRHNQLRRQTTACSINVEPSSNWPPASLDHGDTVESMRRHTVSDHLCLCCRCTLDNAVRCGGGATDVHRSSILGDKVQMFSHIQSVFYWILAGLECNSTTKLFVVPRCWIISNRFQNCSPTSHQTSEVVRQRVQI